MPEQLSSCCKAPIKLTGKDRPNAFACEKCERIIGTPMTTPTNNQVAQLPEKLKEEIVFVLEDLGQTKKEAVFLSEMISLAIGRSLSQRERSVREDGRKQGVAQAVSLFMNRLTNLSQEVLLEALQNEQQAHTAQEREA